MSQYDSSDYSTHKEKSSNISLLFYFENVCGWYLNFRHLRGTLTAFVKMIKLSK